jgi:hypothetical protein
MKLERVRTAITFGAHPDNVDVGAGGLVVMTIHTG